ALEFKGEVQDSRESQSDFSVSIVLALLINFVLLVILFNSIWTPLLIGMIMPFGVIGTLLACWAHGLTQYGFFGVVGMLGMLGVVINDSIVLVERLSTVIHTSALSLKEIFDEIAQVTSTRLRAVVVTTLTTVVGLFPTAYGVGGY